MVDTSRSGPDNKIGPIQLMLSLPFIHKFGAAQLHDFVMDNGAPWRHWLCRVSRSNLGKAFDYSYFFVPSVRKLLFPELTGWEGREQHAPSYDNQISVKALRAAFTDGDPARHFAETATRLTWTSPRPWLATDMELRLSPNVSVAFSVEWVDVLLLPQHVGVLLIKVTVDQPLTLSDAANFVRTVKKRVFRRRLSVAVPTFHLHDGTSTNWTNILDEVFHRLVSPEPKWDGQTIAETFGTNFRFIALCGVPREASEHDTPFDDAAEQACFALATGHAGDNEIDRYSHIGLAELRERSMLNTWANWRVLAFDGSLSIAMLSGNPDLDRNMRTCSEITEWAYSLLHALLIGQQVRLHQLTARIRATPSTLRSAVEHTKAAEQEIVKFRRLLWYEQCSHAPLGLQLYALLRAELRLPGMSDALREELTIIKSRIDAEADEIKIRASERTTSVIEFLTVVGIPLGLFIALAQPLINTWVSDRLNNSATATVVVLVSLTLVAAAIYAALRLIGRHRRGD
jgi:hypothetical protein